VNAHIRGVVFIQEIDDYNVMLLAVAVTAPDALFDTLRIPRQIVVDDQGAELKIDAFGTCLSRDHDTALVAEVVH